MPDTDAQTDPLAAAFASFTSSARGEIEVPGASTARRTVARRRLGSAVAGGLAVLLVAGGVGYAAATRHRPTRPPAPAPVATPSPSADSTDAGRLAELAMAALINAPQRTGTETETIGNDVFPQPDTRANIDPGSRPPGAYALTFVCAGAGTATITWTVGMTTSTVAYACDTPPHLLIHTSVTQATAPGGIAVTITLGGSVAGTYAGTAYRVDRVH